MCKQAYIEGMTLIELMIVVAILAIISAIAIPAYNGYITTTYRTECTKEVAAIRLAEEEHFLENNFYFVGTDSADLQTNSGGIYKISKEVNDGDNNCTYEVTSADATITYTVNANKVAGGKLDSLPDPIATFSKE